jgi:hypothetical protein
LEPSRGLQYTTLWEMFPPKLQRHISQIAPTGCLGSRKSGGQTLLIWLMSRIRILVGCISILQLPRSVIKFWQVNVKHLIVTYEQSGTEVNEISQPEAFEVGPYRSCLMSLLTITVW